MDGCKKCIPLLQTHCPPLYFILIYCHIIHPSLVSAARFLWCNLCLCFTYFYLPDIWGAMNISMLLIQFSNKQQKQRRQQFYLFHQFNKIYSELVLRLTFIYLCNTEKIVWKPSLCKNYVNTDLLLRWLTKIVK